MVDLYICKVKFPRLSVVCLCTVCICNIHSSRRVLELSASWETGQNKGKAESSATSMTYSLTDTLQSILSPAPYIPLKTIAVCVCVCVCVCVSVCVCVCVCDREREREREREILYIYIYIYIHINVLIYA